jgi:membrane associated rhomboid family serine protease
MGKMVCLGMGVWFLVIGHSHLLGSYGFAGDRIPLKRLLFPKPQKGRFVAGLCFFMSFLFFCTLFPRPLDFDWADSRTWKASIFGLAPLLLYAAFVLPRLRREENAIVFHLDSYGQKSQLSLRLIIGFFALANVVYFMFWRK